MYENAVKNFIFNLFFSIWKKYEFDHSDSCSLFLSDKSALSETDKSVPYETPFVELERSLRFFLLFPTDFFFRNDTYVNLRFEKKSVKEKKRRLREQKFPLFSILFSMAMMTRSNCAKITR